MQKVLNNPNNSKKVPEIEGLRAIAVMSVVLWHTNEDFVANGFLGVDMFFVISGYLIHKKFIELAAQNSFSMVTFLEKRLRRIIPSLYFMLLLTLPASILILTKNDLNVHMQGALSAALANSNNYFAGLNGYWDIPAKYQALLHTWSLSVELQYYALISIVYFISIHTGLRINLASIVMLACASLLIPFIYPLTAEKIFFSLITRIWEFMFGVYTAAVINNLVVVSAPEKDCNSLLERFRQEIIVILVIFTLAGVLYIPFDSEHVNRQYLTLVTVLLTAVLLYCFQKPFQTRRLFRVTPLVIIGSLSYSIYLFHQPVIVFMRYLVPDYDIEHVLLCYFIILLLSFISYRIVELPFRSRYAVSGRLFLLFGGVSFLVIAVVVSLSITRSTTAVTINDEDGYENRLPLAPDVKTLCSIGYSASIGADTSHCEFSATNPQKKIWVLGDSHAEMYLPMFNVISREREVDVSYRGTFPHGGCPPLIDVDVENGQHKKGVCNRLLADSINELINRQVDVVILIARWSIYVSKRVAQANERFNLTLKDVRSESINPLSNVELFEYSLRRTVEKLKENGIETFILLENPFQLVHPVHVSRSQLRGQLSISEYNRKVVHYSVPFKHHMRYQNQNREVILKMADLGAKILIPDRFFCESGICIFAKSKILYYRDANHLSGEGVMIQRDLFENALGLQSQYLGKP